MCSLAFVVASVRARPAGWFRPPGSDHAGSMAKGRHQFEVENRK
jgi:hypothetical protein